MKKKLPEILYYSDPLNDEFSGISKKTITVDKNFKYISPNPIWKIISFFIYRIILTPFCYLHCKRKFKYKIKNRNMLKQLRHDGYFVYANHTLEGGDAFFPSIVNAPKKPYIIVNADNVSTKGTKNLVMMLGAIPIPTKFNGIPKFMDTIKTRWQQHHPIYIYPEAHIWPYYTGIRPFEATSFKYPAELNSPVYASTTTFQKPKRGKIPRITIYLDGPFYPDKNLSIKDNQQKLRDQVYEAMLERSKNSTYEVIKYERKN
ncbi:MAG: 1-acyl-sn-glycerol-3-phosphate acyltransferase [Clostridia bacterium]|nr:1-acyl-sn-glycerol-3-phosphate acyltransferase [Clostridia bacterium]